MRPVDRVITSTRATAPPRICIVAAGHLTTCPRLVKAARAFASSGYHVRVVSAMVMDRFRQMDIDLVAREGWEWDPIELTADRALARWLWTGVRHRAAKRIAAFEPRRVPLRIATAAFHRLHRELLRRAARKSADLYYGGAGGATAAVADAASRRGAKFGVDLEDFHTGQAEGDVRQTIVERIERDVLERAAFLTAGSPAIADAYRAKYGLRVTAVCNTFPLPAAAPTNGLGEEGAPLRLYWFSQTIGAGRGLEAVVDAMALSRMPGELHLRGAVDDLFVTALRTRIARQAPRLRLVIHGVDSSQLMVTLCRPYDVGLAAEPGSSLNNALSLSNKALTYPLAGLALAVTDTPGHRPLIDDLGEGAVVYHPQDVETLASGLRAWNENRIALRAAKDASWRAAARRWHWEDHDRETLLDAARKAAAS
jgi:hypothetical protein